jgi:uncharacterized membrane protein
MAAKAGITPGRWIAGGWKVFKEDIGNFILITLIFIALCLIGNIVVAGALLAGMFHSVRRCMLEGHTDLMDLFKGFSNFIDTLLVFLLVVVFLNIGLVLCVFPVLIVAAFYLFSYSYLVDRKLSFWDAMESSRRLVVGNLLGYILFVVLLGFLNLAGFLLAGIGLLFTIPISIGAIMTAYRDQVGFAVSPPTKATAPIIIP